MGFMTGVLRMLGAAEEEQEYEQIVEYPTRGRAGREQAEQEGRILSMPGHDATTMCIYRPQMQAPGQPGFSMRTYAGELLARKAIIVDVNELAAEDLDEATRVIDYLSGVAEAVAGSIYEIAKNIFIFAPSNITLGGDPLKQVEVY
ncbi:MAG: cell division protein SepF [bacterium]|nr:cell division protein SepF [bacterium]